ncbi:SDR family NAD(P)-dependent oxidoreductase [Prosthecomicrobium pneumaticum]|uniref:NAD(P)-dependent dehydrogenase (Short-subunit alcohol dehydrogenase family) n=1 Tax=Prosthecomicrobium pneumaticum TaxID=81895 RepID=A0A7W9FLL8_9HYPH|nr:SDR family NAD(P)-dependent oxidoreductase [Prosthecomicrobium pneumaticum]MBB5752922.1 NAD(P)-dependent dehydrogenase (short-subunit alcohol dehydrogenase family) [Prosthecomicrobium pneumaticum]
MKRFEDRVVVVTGGGGAIGAAAARRFASEGAKLAIVDRDRARAQAVADELVAAGGAALAIEADVGSELDAEDAICETVGVLGGLDVLFNNAGIPGKVAPVHDLAVEDWDEIVRINLRGIFLVQRFALRAMIAAKTKGSVVNMASSMAGFDVLAGGAGYAATKHAVLGLTRIAALDAAAYGIRVNAVCPGVIETRLGVPAGDEAEYRAGIARFADRIPLRRIGQPEDVAAVVAFLASDEAAHVTGAGWLIDGGQTMQSWANAPDAEAYPRFV